MSASRQQMSCTLCIFTREFEGLNLKWWQIASPAVLGEGFGYSVEILASKELNISYN
jgi:hypothetical protein